MSDPARRAWLRTACEEIGRRLDKVVYPQLAPSYEWLAEQLSGGSIDVAWTPPLVAAAVLGRGHGTPVACSRRDGAARYRAVIFTKQSSGIHIASELAGKSVAWVGKTSASGYVVPRVWLRDNGHDPDTLFSKQSFLGSHGAVARAVLRGEADVGATFALFGAGLRATVEAGWTEVDAHAADEILVVVNAGGVPADCITVSTRLPKDVQSSIAEAFLGLTGAALKPFRQALGAEGYQRPAPDHRVALERLLFEASYGIRQASSRR